MRPFRLFPPYHNNRYITIGSLLAIFLVVLGACNFIAPAKDKDSDKNLEETRVALSVEQTVAAGKDTEAQATIAAQQAIIQTQAALATMQAQQPPPAQATAPGVPAPPVQPGNTPLAPGNFNEQMKNAQILLFEDAIANPALQRYVKETLDNMGLRYKDDGNAIGWLKNDLLSGSPTGKPWDLVILAIEARGNVSGEYFDYLEEVLNKGTPVIMEAWHLDAISKGKIAPILAKCGVQVYPYFPSRGDLTDVVLYPYDAAQTHPIMNDPNRGLTFTKSLTTWLFTGDLGSLMAYTGQGNPVFLLGRDTKNQVKDGALVTCMNGQLILQTFSSHSFSYQRMGPLWENYITNALRVRFGGG